MASAVVFLIALCFAPHPSSAARSEQREAEGNPKLEELIDAALAVGAQRDASPELPGIPWASKAELASIETCRGKQVGVGSFHVVVEQKLGEGKSGEAWRVAITAPREHALETAILKVQLKKAVEELSDEAGIMQKAAGVPHASQLLAFGRVWIPGSISGTLLPHYGAAEALLMTAAPGGELEKKLPVPDSELAKLKADLQEFADAMYAKRLFHGDLTASNVFWDGKEATVIDFGNGQDLSVPATRQQDMGIRFKISDAKDEMRQFLKAVDKSQR